MIERGSTPEQPKKTTNAFEGIRREIDTNPPSVRAEFPQFKEAGLKKIEKPATKNDQPTEMKESNKELSQSKNQEQQGEKRKPFTMVMVKHSENNLDHLDPWKAEIEGALQKHPAGKVVAFVEIADEKSTFNDKLNELHDNGMSYKDAYSHAFFDLVCPEGTEKRTQLIAENTKDGKFYPPADRSKFRAEAVSIVDELDKAYPGRIRLI